MTVEQTARGNAREDAYVLGRSSRELERLDLQGIIYRGTTRRALTSCGIEEGMRVLDVGCGSGDVTRLVADLVGQSGSVLGIDSNAQTVHYARQRAAQLGVANVAFEVGEAASFSQSESFDALVARFLLMHQQLPAQTLAEVAKAVRPGGVVMMLESHMAGLLDCQHSYPKSPLYDKVVRWKCRVVAAAGADIEAGLGLYRTFREAKLPLPQMHMEAPVEGGADSLIYRYMAESVRSMLAMADRHGIDGFSPETVERLEASLRNEVVAGGGTLMCWPVVSAWCRLAGAEPRIASIAG
jgi:ubiquinone/menaquinone biosynthesis C-methylase UbiE